MSGVPQAGVQTLKITNAKKIQGLWGRKPHNISSHKQYGALYRMEINRITATWWL